MYIHMLRTTNNKHTHTQINTSNTSIPRFRISQHGHAIFAAVGLINNNVFISASRDSSRTQDGS